MSSGKSEMGESPHEKGRMRSSVPAPLAQSLMRTALSYAGRGIPVFPCEPAAKRPLTPGGFWDATTDTGSIRGWWGRWPSANIVVPTGPPSGLVVLDIDQRSGGMESFALLVRRHGPAPTTARSRTGVGEGSTCSSDTHPAKRYETAPIYYGPGLDVRGEGGYVVVPPSRTQKPYTGGVLPILPAAGSFFPHRSTPLVLLA